MFYYFCKGGYNGVIEIYCKLGCHLIVKKKYSVMWFGRTVFLARLYFI